MPESPSPGIAGDAPGGRQESLTPETIDAILADFRSWLQEAASRSEPANDLMPAAQLAEPIDLHMLVGQFTALRHEVNLQTKAVRSQQEQNAETLRQLEQALQSLQQAQPGAPRDGQPIGDEQLRPILKTLVDIADALMVAEREVRRMTQGILPDLDQLVVVPESAPPRPSFWGKLFGRRPPRSGAGGEKRLDRLEQAVERVRGMLGSLVAGYSMSLLRVERALRHHGLEPIVCAGEPFDPEQMEVVDVVAESGLASGEVVEEVRRGYLWRDRVFRYAQVRVAKDSVSPRAAGEHSPAARGET
jgi:molecular chaperone GrpE